MKQSFTTCFLDTVKKFPEHTAILTDGRKKISYRELSEQAQALATQLPRSKLVALSIEKSADYIVALLGCWFAGTAFLPLDPALPPERRDFILSDAKPDLILTQHSLKTIRSAPYNPIELSADMVAYVIYTSGTTGRPKGVVVTHGGLVTMLQAQISAFGLKPGSRSLFYLSINFDASLSDIGTALLSGAVLCIETGSKLDITVNLPGIVREREITHLDIPPSLLRILKPASMPNTLDTIIIGGEACPAEIVRAWAQIFRVINVYGPTEATICTSLCLCDPDTWDKPLIGYPLPGIEYLILDEELYISGPQLAQGYLNQPTLTEQKFILHQGRRFYRTGDRVHLHEDGNIEFLGRIDRQVKLHGQLVELEEIETHIMRQTGIKHAAVLKRPVEGREVLVAFISAQENMPKAEFLKSQLKTVLPEWMIPTHFVFLDDMPITTSGKINFAVLRNKSITIKTTPFTQTQPKNDREKKILRLWQNILKRVDISCNENFFTAGGDSMAVLELTLEAEQHGIPLTPALIVEFPTVSGQATWLFAKNSKLQAGAMTAEALKKDAISGENWLALFDQASLRTLQKTDSRTFLFTGATGFLGSQLLQKLLCQTNDRFYVLVRATNEHDAFKRLSLPTDVKDRVIPICGDLSSPCLGLKQDMWDKLSNEIDTIVHSGALVNMLLPYSALRATNLVATQDIIRLACTGKKKAVHYASTLSVFVSTEKNSGTVCESDRLENTTVVYGGYGQSKWAAEYFLQQVPASACNISMYRLGLITGNTKTGQCSQRDFLSMFINGLVSLGQVPVGMHETLMVDATPVDYAAQVMAQIICSGKYDTYHIANKNGFSFAQILRALRSRGHEIRIVSVAEWMSLMQGRSPTAQESAAWLALCRCLPKKAYERHRVMDLFQATGIIFNMANTDSMLSRSNIILPEADDALLNLYLNYLLEDK